MTEAQVPIRRADLIARQVDDGLVLVSPEAGAVRVLNGVGMAIWNLMDGKRSAAEIVSLLAERFKNVERPRLAEDLDKFLADLAARGLISWQVE